ncbi:MAG TPA: ABC transporter ATP-binding protein [Galbitalea sp.]|jgi:ABC-2 type transport system ATP-binding protein|nr:ABC transporter ATP-binding protein [Galbitalea sp.]
MTEIPAIRLTGLSKKFGNLTAVNDVNLSIRPGEVVALLGPNGAGKSTTIDLLLGLAIPTGGTAELFGEDPRRAIVTGRVGAMLQGGALLPATTVRESVALIQSLHKHPLSVDEAMDRAGVADLAKQKISSLSGGQMQRARFAVAVVSNPDLLILDEPTAAMDVAARHSFWQSMREFTSQGKTVVFATHYLDEADTFADRIVIMSAGRIIADGTPSEVKSVVSGRTLSFTLDPSTGSGTANGPGTGNDRLIAAMRRLPGAATVEVRGTRVEVQTDNSDATLRALLAEYPTAVDIEIVSRNMDDAFMALTSPSTSSGTQASSGTVTTELQGVDK